MDLVLSSVKGRGHSSSATCTKITIKIAITFLLHVMNILNHWTSFISLSKFNTCLSGFHLSKLKDNSTSASVCHSSKLSYHGFIGMYSSEYMITKLRTMAHRGRCAVVLEGHTLSSPYRMHSILRQHTYHTR